MKNTKALRLPVISFCSSSPALSRRASKTLNLLFGLEPTDLSALSVDDKLDRGFRSILPISSKRWDSVASKCHSSGTVIHFLSLTPAESVAALTEEDGRNAFLSLLSVTDSLEFSNTNDTELVSASRDSLASHITPGFQSTAIVLRNSLRRRLEPKYLLGYGGGLPMLRLPTNVDPEPMKSKSGLKEVTIPHFDDATYPNGWSLLESLLSSSLPSPKAGLFQLPGGVALRPLPTALEDRNLSQPSLVFHFENMEEAMKRCMAEGAAVGKIGFNGVGKGQFLVGHKDLPGVDIRLTDDPNFSSSFAEAQDSLLASSISELQNVDVLSEGARDPARDQRVDDPTIGDCWVEFRANLKRPSGFMRRNLNYAMRSTNKRIAKAPELPYE